MELNGKSMDIKAENIEKMKQLFPEAFEEGKIDFDKLRQLLGDYVDDNTERYNFTWNGKGQALRLSQTPSMGTLRPCKEESKDWDTTQNLYIEGDNLEVLKLLQKSYHNKIKMIYIDPPYNTGHDFIYKDDFKASIQQYKKITGQIDGAGNCIGTNSEYSGRYHTNWLNLMYPRLRLARNLLARDGVICISMNDDELANLKKICAEVFGESNFEGHIHWRRRHNQPNDKTKMIGLVCENILVYAKNSDYLKIIGVGKIDITGKFSNPDNDSRGEWASKPWKVGSDQSGSRYTIKSPTGKIMNEEWMGEEKTFYQLLEDQRIFFPNGGNGFPRKKYFKFERADEGQCATNWWDCSQFGHNQGANGTLTELFGEKNIFSNPKPTELIRGLMQISNVKNNDIVLDFFSGSATAAHAVIQLNAEDQNNRNFIMVQMPEQTDKESEAFKAGYRTICEIGKERIRRAGEQIKTKCPRGGDLDVGFKDFKLDTSNIKKWQADGDTLESALGFAVDNIVTGRSELDVVYEIILKMGLSLTYPVVERNVNGKKIYIIGDGALMICLDSDITLDVAEGMVSLQKEYQPEVWKVVFYDNGFVDDQTKTNSKEILKNAGLDDDAFATI
jgi:adenine-specific DNA-methyltransferase